MSKRPACDGCGKQELPNPKLRAESRSDLPFEWFRYSTRLEGQRFAGLFCGVRCKTTAMVRLLRRIGEVH